MINALILGADIHAEHLYKRIQDYNALMKKRGEEEIKVAAFLAIGKNEPVYSFIQGIPVITAGQVRQYILSPGIRSAEKTDVKEQAEVLLVPRELYRGQQDFLGFFLMLGIGLENIYIANPARQNKPDEEELLELFTPYYSYGYLPYLEFHLADHCNLNCAACEHYSGLVEEPVFPIYEKFKKDLQRLKMFFNEIDTIRLLGGEPLLNPEIENYIRFTRRLYPNADIWIVTNGILLKTMSDDFYDTVRESQGKIWISFYPPLEKTMDSLISFLTEKNVTFGISDKISQFGKCQKLVPGGEEHTNQKYISCYQKGCRNLYDGKLAACFLPFTTKYFNAYFEKNIPEDGAIDLYEEGLSVEKIMKHLTTPFERCKYCDFSIETDWRIINKPSVIEDWIQE